MKHPASVASTASRADKASALPFFSHKGILIPRLVMKFGSEVTYIDYTAKTDLLNEQNFFVPVMNLI